ncbi:DEAD/DEAH box helicase [Aromatoleum petrolei]|uniref:DEAD/DEAH box helicase n=1 Tax=Aromatoleum petrolei TaxID=76116 RepID=A0ABX1MWF9_9RHOO|nr:DEAD/DEAH box helicase [Aromatoleum petrolei]NMF91596.1 DEAD/DEAH box helicase [Aromatoleum petrolei]QTQ37043.1 ATP-dependent RNA helicase [Aromatoleum petrolei]
MTFNELGLNELLLKAIETTGYTVPTEVQVKAIPAAISGADLMVSSHTGSGKTAAFTLPSLSRLVERKPAPGAGPRVLVLTPTRELALQVEKAVKTYGRHLRWLNTACLVGGAPFFAQVKQLSRPVDVVVATPGRLIDHLTRRKIKLSDVETLVLDEADRMLDMGFVEDIETIVAATPASRQTLLFSATLDGVVGNLASKLQRNPQRIEIAPTVENRGNIEQRLMMADNMVHKTRLLESVLGTDGLQQAVVFTATKKSAEEVSLSLQEKGFAAAALHGDMHQTARNRTLDKLRQGRIGVLVATDVAARGIDVAGISHVINFDPPRQVEDYVHRIGRTGRAGRDGIAITMSGPREMGIIRAIERFTGKRMDVHVIEGLEPTARPTSPRRPGGSKPGYGSGRPSGGSSWSRDSRDSRPGTGKGWSSEGRDGNRGGFGRDERSSAPREERPGFGRSEPRSFGDRSAFPRDDRGPRREGSRDGARFGGDRPEGARRPRPAFRD